MSSDALCRNLSPCRTASPMEPFPRSNAQTSSREGEFAFEESNVVISVRQAALTTRYYASAIAWAIAHPRSQPLKYPGHESPQGGFSGGASPSVGGKIGQS